ncbi:HEAT repeat domain-containing protein [Marininema halotolerans]|uniref:HEAT repeat-containing protein n=1 Tax=Marininema halotolerans TaxID=1155944 RepID=A0A1I6THP8_9BACL|nr:hypothetical protein [Marininema halotolerans]SFS88700.1 hypothetical protein SAMN05444972_11022 [Marininema halotolerans]
MKGLSTKEHERFDELYRTPCEKRKQEILHAFANTESLDTLIYLIPFAIKSDETIQNAARETIDHIAFQQCRGEWIGLDQYIRRLNPYLYYKNLSMWIKWHQLSPTVVRSMSIIEEADVSFLGLCSFHRNGYVREAAVESLAGHFSGKEIPFLLLRMNDGVPNIRYKAHLALNVRIRMGSAKYFLKFIHLVKHLAKLYHRENCSALVEEIFSLLRHPDSQDVLISGFYEQDQAVRRFSYELAISLPEVDHHFVISEALRQHDGMIRLQVAKYICKIDQIDEVMPWLERIKRDTFPPVRQLALQTSVERFPDQSLAELHLALLDRNKTIRQMARYYLQGEAVDFPTFYRRKLKEIELRRLPNAIMGLGETGTKSDSQWVAAFVNHERARVHRSAIKVLGVLDPKGYMEVFFQALQSDKRGLSREARDILADHVVLGHANLLEDLYLKDLPLHAKKNILYLFSKLSKADNIFYFIRACNTQEEETRKVAMNYIISWIHGYNMDFFIAMSAEKQQQLKKGFYEVKEWFSAETIHQFAFKYDHE